MSTIRQNKVANLFKREFGDIFQRESRNLFRGNFITVTTVRVRPDFSLAKVYLSIFSKEKESVLKMVKEQVPQIRKLLGQRIKNQVRIIPEIAFFIDDSLEYALEIEQLLDK